MKVVGSSDLCINHLYHQGDNPRTHLFSRLSWPQGHSVAGRTKSINNPSDPIKNITCNLTACMQFLNQLCHYIYNTEIFSDIIWYFAVVSKNAIVGLRQTVHWSINNKNYLFCQITTVFNVQFMKCFNVFIHKCNWNKYEVLLPLINKT